MRKFPFLFIGIFVIIIIAGGILVFYQKKKTPPQISMEDKILSGKKIIMVISFKDFRDEEYFVPKEILEKAGAEIKTASNKKGLALGADGGQVKVDFLVSEVDVNSFDAVVFVGGPGCLENLDNENSYNLAKETISKDKVLAAICISPVILAKAGVLQGKKATVWSSPMDRNPVKILKENGAIYQEEEVVVDGNIITANGPAAAKNFAETLIKILSY